MVLWSYLWVGKTLGCSLFELVDGTCGEALAVGSAGIDLGLLDVDPAEDRHQLVCCRAIVRGARRRRLA
jgi:hypothetical protein